MHLQKRILYIIYEEKKLYDTGQNRLKIRIDYSEIGENQYDGL